MLLCSSAVSATYCLATYRKLLFSRLLLGLVETDLHTNDSAVRQGNLSSDGTFSESPFFLSQLLNQCL